MKECVCETCSYYPPSSGDGKPCSMCDPSCSFLNCYCKKETEEITTCYKELKNRFEEEFDCNLGYSNSAEVNMYVIKDAICGLLDLLDDLARR